VSPSDRRRGLSQHYDKDQNQDREDQRARTQEYDLAHDIGFQQIIAAHKADLKVRRGGWHESPRRARK